ncbi:hypothetical protein ETAA8_57570 [Anatilimnocola aggregata]|uniref:YdhG-like domain-containing protein n=1 Tax=Anatilimnocola aggregata TaxID=2528021 RepID=A0A517YK59_9BACT|nr:DUF1801 domain-containing protein [Anatilimnocola aggregata]QDU30611.1 hypothetical protein ETAA8_57570 [Anatilimnocola aggregata]
MAKARAASQAKSPSQARIKAATVDEYLASVSSPQREALEKLGRSIRLAAPQAEECISYGVPAFKQNGMLASFGAAAKHCSFYVMSSSILASFQKELAGYDTSTGTIRFTAEKPLPASLVKKIIRARLAANAARQAKARK